MTTNTTTGRRLPSTAVPINGPKVRELRIRRGTAVAELAEQVNVTRSYITKIELDHSRRVSPATFNAIMAALGVRSRRVLLRPPDTEVGEAA